MGAAALEVFFVKDTAPDVVPLETATEEGVVVEETASVVISLGNTITVLVIGVTLLGTTVSGTEIIDGEGIANTVVAPVRVVRRII